MLRRAFGLAFGGWISISSSYLARISVTTIGLLRLLNFYGATENIKDFDLPDHYQETTLCPIRFIDSLIHSLINFIQNFVRL